MKIIQFIENVSRAKHAKYFLAQSFVDRIEPNKNIPVGEFFHVDLTKEPFNLMHYIEKFKENDIEERQLVLYDIEKHLRNLDFDEMRHRARAFDTSVV
jgi:hypothetical protein